MELLDRVGAEVADIEQVVVRHRLTLGLIVEVPSGQDVLKELLLFGWENSVDVDFEVVEPTHSETRPTWVVTAIARKLSPRQLGAVSRAIAKADCNIERIVRLSRYPVVSYEMLVSGVQVDQLKAGLIEASAEYEMDIAIQENGLSRRAKRLVVLDVDSTLVADEAIDLLAERAGCRERVADLTARAMAGELDFEEALRSRVALLKGLEASQVTEAVHEMTLTPGARTFIRTLKRLGYKIALVSGGFTQFTDALSQRLGVDHAFANELEVLDGKLTGALAGPVLDRARKAGLLREVADAEGIFIEQTVAVGDGANDMEMLSAAGLGIAFNAKAMVREVADTSVSVPYLDAILYILGVTRAEIEAADDTDPTLSGTLPPGAASPENPPIPE